MSAKAEAGLRKDASYQGKTVSLSMFIIPPIRKDIRKKQQTGTTAQMAVLLQATDHVYQMMGSANAVRLL